MNILGHVETGWFAKLAHGCQSLSQGTLNMVSGSGRWGDRFYNTMSQTADVHMQHFSDQAIMAAKAVGKTSIAALQSANQQLETIANPTNLNELGKLFHHGLAISSDTVVQSIPEIDILGLLTPILIGAGALYVGYEMTQSERTA